MTKYAIRFIYDADFFMLKDQDLSFEICCENTMTGKRNATGQVYSSMVLSYMYRRLYTSTFNYRAMSCFYIL